MKDYQRAEKRDHRRRRRERYLMIILFVVLSFLTFLGVRALDLGLDLPLSSSILIFVLIDINVILLLLLLFLTVRNLVKLLFERKKGIMGAKLRTRLVLAFVILSLLPTAILFFVSVQFISFSIEYWFNLQIEQSLRYSQEVGRDHYNRIADEILYRGNNLGRVISYEGLMLKEKKDGLQKFIHEKRKEYGLASLEVFTEKMAPKAISQDDMIDLSPFKGADEDILRESLEKGSDNQHIQSSRHGDLVSGVVPIFSRTKSKAVIGIIVLGKFIPGSFVNRLQAISKGLQEYSQLKMLKTPMKSILWQVVWLTRIIMLEQHRLTVFGVISTSRFNRALPLMMIQ